MTIVSYLINNKCVCLCRNCHRMITSQRSVQISSELFGDYKRNIIKSDYEAILKNIDRHKFKNIEDIHNIFEKIFPFGTNWKKLLILLFDFYKLSKINQFEARELSVILNIPEKNLPTLYKDLTKLEDMGFLQVNRNVGYRYLYSLTDVGIETAEKYEMKSRNLLRIELEYLRKSKIRIKIKDFTEKSKNLRIKLQDLFKHKKTWRKYLIHIFFIISTNREEFFDVLSLYTSLGVSRDAVNNQLRKMKERGLVQLVKIERNRNIYKLTSEGLRLAKKLWDSLNLRL